MWTKIFRSKSTKCKSRDDIEKSSTAQVSGVQRSKFAKVVSSITLKRHCKSHDYLEDSPVVKDIDRRYEPDNSNRSNEPELAQEPAEVDITLEPCPICTRTFAPQTLKKHIVICERAAIKRRKTFDSSRQRREGTDLADFLPKNFGLPPSKQESKQSPADRTQRQGTTPLLQKKENDVAKVTLPAKKTVSSAPVVNSATKEKSKPILSRLVPTAEPCPHCGRSFGPKAYDRHVEWCKEKARIANSQYNPSVNVAKERLQARTKYKAPCLKSKRAVNREKYSGLSCDESMNSLSDGGSCGSTSKSKEYAQEGAGNTDISMVSTTMSSSLISEGCHVDENSEISFEVEDGDSKHYSNECEISVKEAEIAEIAIRNSKLIGCNNKSTVCKEELTSLERDFSKMPVRRSETSMYLGHYQIDENPKAIYNDSDHEILMKRNDNSICTFKEGHYRIGCAYLSDKEDEFSDGNHRIKVKGAFVKVNEKKRCHYDMERKCRSALSSRQAYKQSTPSKTSIAEEKFLMKKKSLSYDEIMSVGNNEDFQIQIGPQKPIGTITSLISNCKMYSGEEIFVCRDEGNEQQMNVEEEKLQYKLDELFIARAFSDKYDPFLSAKRQLEELCSPTESIPSNASLPATPDAKTHPDLMSKSLNINTTNKLKNIKSNFHRTSSLRVPRKTTPTRSIFASSTKQRPTIQRGISDEGPISTSFLKPEEYDEMPVKSVCINDFAATKHPDNHSTPKIMKREPNLSRNRRNLKTAFTSIEKKGVNPLSKTDSLAIFLQYEHATRVTEIPINLTEKDLKDQSNNLSKQTSSKSSASDLDTILAEKDKLYSLKNSLSSLLDPHHSTGNDKQLSQETTPVPITKIQAIKLDPLPKRLPKSNRSIFPSFPSISKDTEFIDPNLINVCDNLPINVTKLSDNDFTSSSTESVEQAVGSFESQFHLAERQEDNALQPQTTNRNSVEKKNLLKRQLRLGKNHFLYDLSPENDNENINYNNVSRAEIDSNKLDSSISTIDPIPDEFDIEEFISSFENVEEYPLFRDYKAFLSNRSLNKISNNSRGSSRSPTTLRRSNDEEDDHDEEKNEIFSSNESFLKHESDVVPKSAPCTIELNSTTKNLNLNDLNENKYDPPSSPDSDQENEETDIPDVNENIRDVKDFIACEHFEDADPSNDTTDNSKDLSKPSSLESLEIKKSTSSKQSADSAYGSLSRYSPADCVSRRTPACKTLNEGAPEEPQRIREEHDNAKTGSCIRDLGRKPSIEELNLSQFELNQQHLATRIKTDVRMSKFCHECGSKFIITQAKFCMECGVKRIVLE